MMTNKMTERAIQMFGMTQNEVEEEFQHATSSRFDDRLGFAMSILSDAQEEMVRGNTETARLFINKAKYHMSIARPKQVR